MLYFEGITTKRPARNKIRDDPQTNPMKAHTKYILLTIVLIIALISIAVKVWGIL